YVEAGLGNVVSPVSLQKYGYEEYVTAQGRQWAAALDKLFETGKPEPYGKNCEMIYTEMDNPLVEIGLYPDRDPADILNRAAAVIDTKLLNYVPPDVMDRRRKYAFGLVTGGFLILLAGLFTMLRRLAKGVAGEPGARPAGMRSWRFHVAPWLFMAP